MGFNPSCMEGDPYSLWIYEIMQNYVYVQIFLQK